MTTRQRIGWLATIGTVKQHQKGYSRPAMESISTSRASPVPRTRTRPGKLRRRLVRVLVLVIGLFTTGGLYLMLAPAAQVAPPTSTALRPIQR